MSKKVNLGIIGVGLMGSSHVKSALSIGDTNVVAVADVKKDVARRVAKENGVAAYFSAEELLAVEGLDAVVIATPHYAHTPISIAALRRGIHVLVEKPIAVHVRDAVKMIAAYETAKAKKRDLVFAAMFQRRTVGCNKKIKELIESGRLGRLIRATWVVTSWFRTQKYYDCGGWRATWAGEGGGVLLNQCPHQLDLYQWFFGMPRRVTGFVGLGKYHKIEVEDEVTGYMEHANGMVGHFITSTGEFPGTDRLEIACEMGKLICEDNTIRFHKSPGSALDIIKKSKEMWPQLSSEEEGIEYEKTDDRLHRAVIARFAGAILRGEEPVAHAPEGLHSVMIGNAILMSSLKKETYEMPLDGAEYARFLAGLTRKCGKGVRK
jgi:predicted dehydrogenase